MDLATFSPDAASAAELRAAQRLLAAAGVYDGAVDGAFGPVSKAALIAFRRGAAAIVDHVGGIRVFRTAAGVLLFVAGLTVDADGAPHCYGPEGKPTLDDLECAGSPGHWWGIATNNGEPNGEPILQGSNDPAPGYYVSTTSLQNPKFARREQRRYVNSETVPYFVLPDRKFQRWGCRLGDFGTLENLSGDRPAVAAVLGDAGPPTHLGEASIFAARALCIRADARRGGTPYGVVYTVYPGSRAGWPLSNQEISDSVARLRQT